MISLMNIDRGNFRLIIKPNCSLTLKAAFMLVGLFGVVGVAIATYMVILGAWPVLPFVGLELAFVAAVFVFLQKRTEFYDLIESDGDSIKLILRDREGEKRRTLQRYWAQVKVITKHKWYPSQLLLGSHGEFDEIGKFLTEEDRLLLADKLSSSVRSSSQLKQGL